jgi:hypothetical protein
MIHHQTCVQGDERKEQKKNPSIRICIYSAPSANPSFTCIPYQPYQKWNWITASTPICAREGCTCVPVVLIKMPSPLGKLHALQQAHRVFLRDSDQASQADDRGIHEPGTRYLIPVRYDMIGICIICPYYCTLLLCFLAACVCVRAERTPRRLIHVHICFEMWPQEGVSQ